MTLMLETGQRLH